ncbi:MAG TPA: sigma-70 family RNA polymerase sigma factor [Chloroflexota bacterium]
MHAVAEAEARAGRVDPDAALIAAAVGGDAPAFAALYDRYVDRVYRHVYYRLGDRGDAEDLTQQVFLNAWRAIGRYRCTGAPFVAWLFTIAHNAVAGFYRRAKATRDLELELEPVATARWTDPEAEALAAYDRAAVRRAILRLKPEQQQVVIMRFVEGLPYAEIAAALGKGEGHVRVLQHRALHELRRLLARQVVV